MPEQENQSLPTISVVTPSFNQAEFLPNCLATVASQTYAPIEHLVLDPGSTDGSREIAAAAPGVRLIAEPDRGQSDAIRRGCREATGDIIAWLNSDDYYLNDHVFESVATRFAAPDRPDIVYGRGSYLAPNGDVLGQAYIFDEPDRMAASLANGVGVLQPAVFVRRTVMNEVGGPDLALNYAMDYDLWIRLALADKSFAFLDKPLAAAVIHPDAKTEDGSDGSLREALTVVQQHFGFVPWTWAISEATAEIMQDTGVIRPTPSPDQHVRIERRAQELFDGHNRNVRTIARLVRPPWRRPHLAALSHLVRRVGKT